MKVASEVVDRALRLTNVAAVYSESFEELRLKSASYLTGMDVSKGTLREGDRWSRVGAYRRLREYFRGGLNWTVRRGLALGGPAMGHEDGPLGSPSPFCVRGHCYFPQLLLCLSSSVLRPRTHFFAPSPPPRGGFIMAEPQCQQHYKTFDQNGTDDIAAVAIQRLSSARGINHA
jgi:hypothetical protein